MMDQQVGNEVICVGAGNIGYSGSSQELHAMKCKDALKTKGREKWIKVVNEELD
jgi:hypothetical protein